MKPILSSLVVGAIALTTVSLPGCEEYDYDDPTPTTATDRDSTINNRDRDIDPNRPLTADDLDDANETPRSPTYPDGTRP